MRPVCLLGAAMTRFGKLPLGSRELALQAAKESIEIAGIEPKAIQGAFVSNAFALTEKQGHLGPIIMSGLGIPDRPSTTVESACSSGAAAFREAYINVGAGVYDVMLVVGVEKVSHLDTTTATTLFSYGSDYLFESACGASFPGLYAAMARAHMNKYGTTEEQMALVAVKNHANGMLNPKAQFHKAITVEDVMKSPVVAAPLKLYDSSPFSDGAAAAVICSEEFARQYVDSPIYVIGSGKAGGSSALHQREDLTSLTSAKLASREALRHAKVELKDIDFAEVHDCFTIAELVAMEDIGFAEKGKAAKMVEEARTQINGGIPINPSGGLKAKGHPVGATGIGQIVEIFEQLMEKAGPRQVKGATTALTHNVGATGGSCAVHVFRRGS